MKRLLVAASVLLLLTMVLVGWVESRRPQPVLLIPTLTGQPEYCLTCHADLPPISVSHPVEALGCVRCHGGERLALDAGLAHSTLRGGANPSDLAVAEASCGGPGCHSEAQQEGRDQLQRMGTSLHATYAGAIAAVRHAAGAQPDLAARLGAIAAVEPGVTSTVALAAFDPAQESWPQAQTFAQNCLACHASAEPLAGPQYARFTGCAACHTPTAGTELTQPVHRLGTDVAYSQCNTCHYRGTYSVATLQFSPRSDQPANRRQDYYPPGTPVAKCEYLLDCVDCHTRLETMGDGHLYSNQAEARYVQCRTCHGTVAAPPLTYTISRPDELVLRLAALNQAITLQAGDTVIVTERGEALWNTRRLPDGKFEIVDKATGQHLRLPLALGSGCQQKLDKQEARDCHACHSGEH
jgi:hypothetical protein